jgi:hypothetical protein
MNVYQLIKLGRTYLKLWPDRPELSHYFSEYQIIVFSRFVFKYVPALALLALILPVVIPVNSAYPQAFFYALFLASLPVQALVMLGLKADKYLPPSLENWYKESLARINEQGGNLQLSKQKPRYLDLAKLLNLSYQNSSVN